MKVFSTVEKATLLELANELLSKGYIAQEIFNNVCVAIGTGNDKELTYIHNDLLKAKLEKEPTDPSKFSNERDFWKAVEDEVIKINGLIGIYHKSNDGTGYVIRDLKSAGDRDYIAKSSEKDIKQWLSRAGINIKMTLKDDTMDKPLVIDTFERWITNPIAEETAISGFTYLPVAVNKEPKPIVDKKLNVFRSGFALPVKGDGHLEVLDFLKSQLCADNEYIYEVLIKWMAHLMQFPEEKSNLAMSIYHPRRGIGKSTFAKIVGLLVGKRNTTKSADPKDLEGFNSMLSNKLFIVFDEVAFVGDHRSTGKMKKMVTEGEDRNEKKGKDAEEGSSFCRIAMICNERSGTLASVFERRYFDLPIQADWKDSGRLDDFVNRHHLKDAQSANFLVDGRYNIPWVSNLSYYLLNEVDLNGFNFNEVKSVAMDKEIVHNRILNTYRENSVFAFLWEWLASGEDHIEFTRTVERETYDEKICFGDEKISTADFLDAFKQRLKNEFHDNISPITVTRMLQEQYGFVKRNVTAKWHNTQKQCFFIPSREQLYKLMFENNGAVRVQWELPPLKKNSASKEEQERLLKEKVKF